MTDHVPNTKTHVPLRCLSCGHTWSPILYNVHTCNSGCPACSLKRQGERQRVPLADRKKAFMDAGILLLSDHAPANKECAPLLCLSCGHEWTTTVGAVYNGGTGCPICGKERQAVKRRIPTEDHAAYLLKAGIALLSDRISNVNETVDLRCLGCGHEWSTTIMNVRYNKSGCPSCTCISKGANLIKSILKDNHIPYAVEKRFDTCRHIKPLPFDIYAYQLHTLIEFHGPQHRTPIDFFGGQKALELLQKRDRIKTSWAKMNGYKLIIIHSTTKDVESILLRFLGQIRNGSGISLFVSG